MSCMYILVLWLFLNKHFFCGFHCCMGQKILNVQQSKKRIAYVKPFPTNQNIDENE